MRPRFVIDCCLDLMLVGMLLGSSTLSLQSDASPSSLSAQRSSDPDAVNAQINPLETVAVAEPAPETPEVGIAPEEQTLPVETARPGTTMLRQGPALAIERLHPEFVVRLANAISEAQHSGLPSIGIQSAYRPPAFGIGGFVDKFKSLHTYGLAVDMKGVGTPGSPEALLWHQIAVRHGVICPYGPYNRTEWNHCQPTRYKVILAANPLRETVTAQGPVDLDEMFDVGASFIDRKETLANTEPDLEQLAPVAAIKNLILPSSSVRNKMTVGFRHRTFALPALARPAKILAEEKRAKFKGDRHGVVASGGVGRLQARSKSSLQKGTRPPARRFAALAMHRQHAVN
jgi:hypothetical protein